MKKFLKTVLPIVLVCALIAGIVFYAVRSADDSKPSGSEAASQTESAQPESEADEVSEVSADVPEFVDLSEYWAKLKAEKGEEPFTLEEIYLRSADLFLGHNVITFSADICAQYFMIKSGQTTGPMSRKHPPECTVETNPENVSETDVYTVFIASLENCFAESTAVPHNTLNYYLDNIASADYIPALAIPYSTEYLKYGYSTHSEWAVHMSEPYAQIIAYYDSIKITSYDPQKDDNPYEDVYGSYKAAAIANGVKIR